MAEITGIDEVAAGIKQSTEEKLPSVPKEIAIPDNWTILYHGSNLGRDEWQGERKNVLDSEIFINEARGLGLSCVTKEDREEATYDTTRGFSTVPTGKIDEPLEIRIAFPAFHSRTKRLINAKPVYEGRYGVKRTEEILRLANKVHWGLNQQHPVVPRGLRLIKLQDYKDEKGKRVVSYVPEALKDIYDRELTEVAQEK